jgi:hypothetical protein
MELLNTLYDLMGLVFVLGECARRNTPSFKLTRKVKND